MKRSTAIFVFTLAALFVLSETQPAIAFSAAQVSGLTFQYPQYLNGVYIFSDSVVNVAFTITNVGSQWTLFLVCTAQRVGFSSGSYGDTHLLGCKAIGLGAFCASTFINYCVSSSGIGAIPGAVYASAPGQLQIRVLVYDPAVSVNVPLTASPWTPVTQIVPQN